MAQCRNNTSRATSRRLPSNTAPLPHPVTAVASPKPSLVAPPTSRTIPDQAPPLELVPLPVEQSLVSTTLPRRHRLEDACFDPTSSLSRQAQSDMLFLSEEGLATATVRNHARAWSEWNEFLNQSPAASTNPFMLGISHRDYNYHLIQWACWLRQADKVGPATLSQKMSNLRSNWLTANITRPALSADEFKRLLGSLRFTEEEQREALSKRRGNQKFPLAAEMLGSCWDSHFESLLPAFQEGPVGTKIGGFLAAVLTEETAQRGANWVGVRALKTIDLRFQIGLGQPSLDGSFDIHDEATGDKARSHLVGTGSIKSIKANLFRIQRVSMDFLRTKTTPVTDMVIARRTPEESRIVDALGMWLCLSNTEDSEPFLTKHTLQTWKGKRLVKASTRVINSSDLTKVVKESATLLGLPEKAFSMKSCRSGGYSQMKGSGASQETIHKRTNHTKNSTVGRRHYDFSTISAEGGRGESIGPAGLGKGKFDLEKLKEIIPKTIQNQEAKEGTAVGQESKGPVRRRGNRKKRAPDLLEYSALSVQVPNKSPEGHGGKL